MKQTKLFRNFLVVFSLCSLIMTSGCATMIDATTGEELTTIQEIQVTTENLTDVWLSAAEAYDNAYDNFPEQQEYLVENIRPILETARISLIIARKAVSAYQEGQDTDSIFELVEIASTNITSVYNLLTTE